MGRIGELLNRAVHLVPPAIRTPVLVRLEPLLAPHAGAILAPATASVTVAGRLSEPSGLAEGARLMLEALRGAGVAARAADIGDVPDPALVQAQPGPGTLIIHVNGPNIPRAMRQLGRAVVRGKRIVGYWAWEVPALPPSWDVAYRFVHDIWAPSPFAAEAMRRAGGPDVQVLMHPVAEPAPAALDRASFGLPAGAFVTLCVFNAGSSIERKNPLGAIRAHRAAFGDDPARLLVIKTFNTFFEPAPWQAVRAAAAEAGNVRIIDETMPPDAVTALTAVSDCVISLHRGEGFGLSLAEAMALGKPVVATGWSGNMAFMTEANAALVAFRLVPAVDPQDVFTPAHTVWAEPDVDAAAAWLRRLAEDGELRARIGAAGREAVREVLSPARYGRRLVELVGAAS